MSNRPGVRTAAKLSLAFTAMIMSMSVATGLPVASAGGPAAAVGAVLATATALHMIVG